MIEDDISYYRRRIEQERSAAGSAGCEIARDTHLELVDLYTARLTMLESASLWQAPSPSPGRRSLSALFAATIERPANVAEAVRPAAPFMLDRRPH